MTLIGLRQMWKLDEVLRAMDSGDSFYTKKREHRKDCKGGKIYVHGLPKDIHSVSL